MNQDGGSITWKVIATAGAFMLWAVLAYLGMGIRTDISEMKSSFASQSTAIELSKQRVDIHNAIISELQSNHREMQRDVDQVKDTMNFWQKAYGWQKH